jgi:hypothetical protein
MTGQIPCVRWNCRLIYGYGAILTGSRRDAWDDFDFTAADVESAWKIDLYITCDIRWRPASVFDIERLTVLNGEMLLIETTFGPFTLRGDPSDGGSITHGSRFN